jgi:hypothetical protein
MDRPPTRLGRHPSNDGILFKGRWSRLMLDGDGLQSRGAGVGVLVPGLDSGDEWFSRIWGDQGDDLLALRLDERVTGPLPRERHAGDGPLGRFVDGLQEYVLSPAILDRLEIVFVEPHDYRIGKPEGVRIQLNLHDDFYGYVAPADPPTLRAAAGQHLAFHEEYLGSERGLESFIQPLCDLVAAGGEVRLKCRGGALHVTSGDGSGTRRTSIWWPVVPID